MTVRIVAPSDLHPHERDQVKEYVAAAAAAGTVVGAVVGAEVREIKPLLLTRGTLVLLRFTAESRPITQEDPIRDLQVLYHKLALVRGAAPATTTGRLRDSSWVLRPFYQLSLRQALASQPRVPIGDPWSLMFRLVELLNDCQRKGVTHGHLCCENVCLEDGAPVVVDFGFHPRGKSDAYSAPEVRRGEFPGLAADVYGLGMVVRELFGAKLPPELKGLIEAMIAASPDQRPDIETISQLLRSGWGGEALPAEANPARTGTALRKGKLLGAGVTFAGIEKPKLIEAVQIKAARDPQEAMQWVRGTVALSSEVVAEIRKNIGSTAEAGPVDLRSAPASRAPAPDRELSAEPKRGELDIAGQAAPTDHRQTKKVHLQSEAPIRTWTLAIYLAAFLLIVGITAVTVYPYALAYLRGYSSAWTSGNPREMGRVAAAALVDQDPRAEKIILNDILEGNDRPQVNGALIRSAFNPAWRKQLSAQDRQAILGLALGKLAAGQVRQLPPLESLHAGALLALIGSMDLDQTIPEVAALPLAKMSSLPVPYAPSFMVMSQFGEQTFASRQARAMAHILNGENSARTLTAYFGEEEQLAAALAKLKLILLLPKDLQPSANKLFELLSKRDSILGTFGRWFEDADQRQWDEVAPDVKLTIMSGELPAASGALTLAALADLLAFPLSEVRLAAADQLAAGPLRDKAAERTLKLLAGEDNRLTRAQSAALVMLLSLESDKQKVVAAEWYKSAPDVQTVLQLVLSRTGPAVLDPLSFEGARYLKDAHWNADLSTVALLLANQEPLVRALGYARLDAVIPAHREILSRALEVETNNRLLKEIEWKLGHERK